MSQTSIDAELYKFHKAVAAMSIAGKVVAYLYIEATGYRTVMGYHRDHWWARKQPIFGPEKTMGEYEIRWCEPAPEASHYEVWSHSATGFEEQQLATAELVKELNSGTFFVYPNMHDLRWLTGAEKEDILRRFFSLSVIRED